MTYESFYILTVFRSILLCPYVLDSNHDGLGYLFFLVYLFLLKEYLQVSLPITLLPLYH